VRRRRKSPKILQHDQQILRHDEEPRLARRKRDNELYAQFLLDRRLELDKGTAVVVVGFPKKRKVVKQG
jgi:hypothetical protein